MIDLLPQPVWLLGVFAGFMFMIWASLKGSHNLWLARMSTLGFVVSFSIPGFYPNVLEHNILKWVCFSGFVIFAIGAIVWGLIDLTKHTARHSDN